MKNVYWEKSKGKKLESPNPIIGKLENVIQNRTTATEDRNTHHRLNGALRGLRGGKFTWKE